MCNLMFGKFGLCVDTSLGRLILAVGVGLGLLFLEACEAVPTSTTCRVPVVHVTCVVDRGRVNTDFSCPDQTLSGSRI